MTYRSRSGHGKVATFVEPMVEDEAPAGN